MQPRLKLGDLVKQAFYRTTPYRQVITFTVPSLILLALLIIGFAFEGSQQYTLLAKAFLHGQLNFLSPIGGAGQDPVFWHGKIYWGQGAFPAVVLMPFVGLFGLFHLFFYQGYLKWLLVLGVWLLVWKLGQLLTYTKEDSAILAFGFTLGSVFIGVASVSASWYFAQVITTVLLFGSFYEFYRSKQKRWWLIGTLCALILMTRATAAPICLFYGWELWRTAGPRAYRFKWLLQFGLPLAGAVGLLAAYNFARFHSPFDGGYGRQLLYPASAEAQSYGLFSLAHIPTNAYSALLRGPLPVLRDNTSWTLKFPYIKNNPYGLSLFMTSPYLLYLFTQKWPSFDTRLRTLLGAVCISAVLLFSYFGVGAVQFGYRYALDFLPGLFVVFMVMYRKRHTRLPAGMKALLLGSGITNFYLLCTLIFP